LCTKPREILGTTTAVRDEHDLLGTNHFYGLVERFYDKIFTSESFWSVTVRHRFFSLGLVIATGFLLLTSLVVTASLSAAERFVSYLLPLSVLVLQCVNVVFSFSMIAILFALIFKFIPDTTIRWRDVRMGAAVTSVLFTVGKVLIGFYFGHSALTSAYGAAASLVVFLIWIYYSAQILLFGAELTHVYALKYGSRMEIDFSQ
jgi:membrane protein